MGESTKPLKTIPKQVINDGILYGHVTQERDLAGESFGPYSNPDVPEYQEENGIEVGKQGLEETGYTFDDNGMACFPK